VTIGDNPGDYLLSAGAHGVIGGIISEAEGGTFQSGFLAGGVGGLTDPYALGTSNRYLGAGISAVSGGAGSLLGGGKFANGAETGAFGYLFNAAVHDQQLQAKFENFFNQLYGPALTIANQLNTCVQCVLGVAAYESGYYSDQHDIDLNNPWGSTQAGGNDLQFGSLQDAANYWEQSNAWRFTGAPATTNSEFINDLEKVPAYNSANPNYSSNLNGIINSVGTRMNIWLQEHPQN